MDVIPDVHAPRRAAAIIDKHLGVRISTPQGPFRVGAYRIGSDSGISDHIVIHRALDAEPLNLRLNSACYTGDILGCRRCDCSEQLELALERIAAEGQGLVIYHLDHEGRGNGIVGKLRSYGSTWVDATVVERYSSLPDVRTYDDALLILADLGVRRVKLLSNSPVKRQALEAGGITVDSMDPVVSEDDGLRAFYEYKRDVLGHQIGEPPA